MINRNLTNPNPRSVAELLWHRFGLRDGRALTLVLGHPEQRSNRDALFHWVRNHLEHYVDNGMPQPVPQLESDLACRLIESGLPGGALDVAVRHDHSDHPSGTRDARRQAGSRIPSQGNADTPSSGTAASNVIPLAPRSDS